jgi:hypothetical protein
MGRLGYGMPENDPAKFAKSPLLFSALIGTLQAVAQVGFFIFNPSQHFRDEVIILIAWLMFLVPTGIVAIELIFIAVVLGFFVVQDVVAPKKNRD